LGGGVGVKSSRNIVLLLPLTIIVRAGVILKDPVSWTGCGLL